MASHDFCQGCEKCDAYARISMRNAEIQKINDAIQVLKETQNNGSANEQAKVSEAIDILRRRITTIKNS